MCRLFHAVPLLLALLVPSVEGKWETHRLATIPDEIDIPHLTGLVFSENGNAVAYTFVSGRIRKMIAYRGEEPGPRFDSVGNLRFSPDGRRLAYVAARGTKRFIVADGKSGPSFNDVGDPVFHPERNELSYCAVNRDQSLVVRDTGGRRKLIPTGEYFQVRPFSMRGATFLPEPSYRPDGKDLAYITCDKKGRRVVVGKRPRKRYNDVSIPRFSPNGKRTAYAAQVSTRQYLVVDEREIELGSVFGIVVGDVVFSPDSKSVACILSDSGEEKPGKPWGGLQLGNQHVFFEGQRSKAYDEIRQIAFAPKGKTLYMAARSGGLWRLYRDGKPLKGEHDDFRAFALSPDGKKIAVAAAKDGKWRIHVGDVKSVQYDWVGAPVFKEDGTKVAFGARDGRELWWVVLELK